ISAPQATNFCLQIGDVVVGTTPLHQLQQFLQRCLPLLFMIIMRMFHLPQTGQLPVLVYEYGEEVVVIEAIHFLCKTQHKTNPNVRLNSPNRVPI
ncbi:hypothetical protein AB205_0053350, partial [Aquarana catesbeiana]